jgi:hypothetical protein
VPQVPRPRFREIDVLALLVVAVVIAHTWFARQALNPDGVSYLDLAGVLRRGDWSAFVQGYWSPFYPALIALIGGITGAGHLGMILIAHLLNGAATLLALAILWHWARDRHPFVGRAMIAALLLCSAGLPRIEAVTPDVLLLALIAALSYEALAKGGRNWFAIGLLLGLAFLIKTSAWPWLLVLIPLRLWGARGRDARVGVLRSTAVCIGLMLLWVVPVSLKYHEATLGSAGRLNYCWYLEHCDSRTPDTHLGNHRQYREVSLSDSVQMRWVDFDQSLPWTYAPWSDPTAWDAGVLTTGVTPPCASCTIGYWVEQARLVFGLWLLPLLLAAVLPLAWLDRRRGMLRELSGFHRDALTWSLAGLAGLAQFIAVHTEPRLIAPAALLLGLAAIQWLASPPPGSTPPATSPALGARAIRQLVASAGLIAVVGFGITRFGQAVDGAEHIAGVVASVSQTNADLAARGISQDHILVIGPVMPAEPSIYLAGGHVVAQIPPSSLPAFNALSSLRQSQLVTQLFGARARMVWLTTADADVRMVIIPQ